MSNFAIDSIKRKHSVRDILAMFGHEAPRDGVKFRSPLRPDNNPSCTIHEAKLWDHSRGESYDQLDLYCSLRGCTVSEAIAQLGGERVHNCEQMAPIGVTPTTDRQDDEERQRKRDSWPDFDEGAPEEIESLARLRGISDYALREASLRGWLRFCDTKFGRAWVVTDSTRKNAQARLLSGDQWPDIEAKAKTLPGSLASTPLGLDDIGNADFVGIFEGGPDWLAGLDLLGHRNRGQAFAVVGILGAANRIPDNLRAAFQDKIVRIYRHADSAGEAASRRWAAQLVGIAQRVECVKPTIGKDWHDILRVNQAAHEKHKDTIEEALRIGGAK
jgi:hypothetical protein